MAKKSKNIELYIGIGVIIIIIIIIIIGFATNWFQPKKENEQQMSVPNIKKEKNIILPDKEKLTDDGRIVIQNQDGTEKIIESNEINSLISDVKTEYANNMTQWHNEIRGKCGNTPSLTWDDQLAKQSTEYARKLHNYGCTWHQYWHFKHDNGGTCHFDQITPKHKDYDMLINSSYCSEIPSGENIATGTGYTNSAEDIIRAGKEAITGTNRQNVTGYSDGWAGEGFNKQTGDKKNPTAPTSKHYTAMNWKTSTKLGCGTFIKNGCAITVCHYADQPSNVNSKVENVMCEEPLQLDSKN